MEEYDFLKSHEKTNINEYCKSILYFEYGLIVSRIQYEIAKTRGISKTSLISHSLPILVEDKLTVRDMGFSDTMTPDFIFTKYEAVGEFKGFKRNVADQSYRVAVTGYALAYEKSHHTKVDVGCVLFLDLEKTKETPLFELDVFVINDELRRAFLLKRNTSLEIVYKQIEPKLATKCPRSCPFLEFCKPESDNIDESK
jgi:CRISPR-associated protein Cas4/Csa1 subtype I-A